MSGYRLALLGLLLGLPAPLAAQGTLEEAAGRARELWLAHDAAGLVAASDTVQLQLPGMDPYAALAPGQAARLLNRYLEAARELAFDLRGVRPGAAEHGYLEARRRYVVRGTSEEREETVYVEFRMLEGRWRVRAVRIVP